MKHSVRLLSLALFAPIAAIGATNSTDLASTINTSNPALQSNSNGAFNDTSVTTTMNSSGNAFSNGGSGQGGNAVGGNVSMHMPHQAPAMFMPAPPPTAPCQATIGGVLSLFIFGGVGGNGSYDLQWCRILEEARLWVANGDRDTAAEVLCQSKYSENTIRCVRTARLRKEIDKADAEDAANEAQ